MSSSTILARLAVSAVLLVGTVLYTVQALSFGQEARYVPLLAGGGASVLLILVVIREIVRITAQARGEAREETRTIEGGADIALTGAVLIASAKYVGWTLALLAAVWQVGLLAAGPVFAAAFLRVDSKVGWWKCAVVGLGLYGLFVFLGTYVGFVFP